MVFGWLRRRKNKEPVKPTVQVLHRASPVKSPPSTSSSRGRTYDDSGTPDPTPFTPTWDAGDSYSSSSDTSCSSSDSSSSSDSGGSCGGSD